MVYTAALLPSLMDVDSYLVYVRVTGYELRLLIIILVGFAHVLAHTPPNARTIEF